MSDLNKAFYDGGEWIGIIYITCLIGIGFYFFPNFFYDIRNILADSIKPHVAAASKPLSVNDQVLEKLESIDQHLCVLIDQSHGKDYR